MVYLVTPIDKNDPYAKEIMDNVLKKTGEVIENIYFLYRLENGKMTRVLILAKKDNEGKMLHYASNPVIVKSKEERQMIIGFMSEHGCIL